MSPPSCPVSGSEHVTPRFPQARPDGHGSPPSAVLSGRYDLLLRILVRQPAPCGCLPIRVRYRSPVASRPDAGLGSGLFALAVPFQGPRPRARAGSPRFPGPPSHDSAPVHDPGRPVAPRNWRRYRYCPQVDHPEGVVIGTLEAYRDASSPVVYASRRTLPLAMQDSLPGGGLRLCRAGVEPAGALRKAQIKSSSFPGLRLAQGQYSSTPINRSSGVAMPGWMWTAHKKPLLWLPPLSHNSRSCTPVRTREIRQKRC